MELRFIKSGDYYIPDIQLQNPNIRLGKWGLMRKSYLRIAQPFLFSEMVLSETLYSIQENFAAVLRFKAANQLEWVRQMNACVAQAEEVIKDELIYS